MYLRFIHLHVRDGQEAAFARFYEASVIPALAATPGCLYAGLLAEWMTFHLGGEPIIELTGPDTATGMWPLFDYIGNKGKFLKGYGHYHDRYRFEEGAWRIDYMALTRVRSDSALRS